MVGKSIYCYLAFCNKHSSDGVNVKYSHWKQLTQKVRSLDNLEEYLLRSCLLIKLLTICKSDKDLILKSRFTELAVKLYWETHGSVISFNISLKYIHTAANAHPIVTLLYHKTR